MKFVKVVGVCATVIGIAVLCMRTDDADAGGKKPKIDPKAFKKILNKIDPEILAAQASLNKAKADLAAAIKKLDAAMSDEVFGEKGTTEGAVIDRLKASKSAAQAALKDVNVAILQANAAQKLDKGGD